MFYDRQVKYFDDIVSGERNGNAGFVKIEVRENVCNINLCIKGLKKEDSRTIPVYLESGDRNGKLCSMELKEGNGTKQFWRLDAENIGDTGISYQELERVKISLSKEREICAVFDKKSGQAESHEPSVDLIMTEERVVEQLVVEQPVVEEARIEVAGIDEPRIEEPEVEEPKMSLKETKWKQLWEVYPHISPFQDGRKYLSVGLGDFVVLPEKYFSVVNNSFLLHGFYNYHYLVLKREEVYGEVRYYLGVPGIFYDREKQVAVMFGFESFECMQEPAEMGDFGYYLMRIEL